MKRKLCTPDLTQFIRNRKQGPMLSVCAPAAAIVRRLRNSNLTSKVGHYTSLTKWKNSSMKRNDTGEILWDRQKSEGKAYRRQQLSPQALIQWRWSQTRTWRRHRMGRMTTLTQKQITCSAHALNWDPPSSFPVLFYACRLRATVVIMAVSVPVMVWENARDLFLS